MFQDSERISEITKIFGYDGKNTGVTEVQIALLTERINKLKCHFERYKKDRHSRRGLLKIVSHRRKLLNYLKRNSISRYNFLILKLKLRH